MNRILIGVSSCLLGEPVRYDGGHKRDAYINGTLSRYFEFVPMCPEAAIGLGVPRPTIRLVQRGDEIRAEGSDSGYDVTDRLKDYADRQRPVHETLCGYLLKNRSPSCGMERVKVYDRGMPEKRGAGIYAAQMMANLPNLPVEEEGRLGDPALRENFIKRVYIYHRWMSLRRRGMTVRDLTDFHARHKLIAMSHHQDRSRELGRIAASASPETIDRTADDYFRFLMETLRQPASRSNHVNVLQHIQGYLKKHLDADDKQELVETIDAYRRGELPLIVPITLLKHHFRKAPDEYIRNSWYMNPHPAELNLLNVL